VRTQSIKRRRKIRALGTVQDKLVGAAEVREIGESCSILSCRRKRSFLNSWLERSAFDGGTNISETHPTAETTGGTSGYNPKEDGKSAQERMNPSQTGGEPYAWAATSPPLKTLSGEGLQWEEKTGREP